MSSMEPPNINVQQRNFLAISLRSKINEPVEAGGNKRAARDGICRAGISKERHQMDGYWEHDCRFLVAIHPKSHGKVPDHFPKQNGLRTRSSANCRPSLGPHGNIRTIIII